MAGVALATEKFSVMFCWSEVSRCTIKVIDGPDGLNSRGETERRIEQGVSSNFESC